MSAPEPAAVEATQRKPEATSAVATHESGSPDALASLAAPMQLWGPRQAHLDPAQLTALQQTAGNKAVARLVAGKGHVQRAPERNMSNPLTALSGESDVWADPVSTKPVDQMTYTEVQDEINKIQRWMSKQLSTTPEGAKREQRLQLLFGRLQELGKTGAKRRGTPAVAVRPRALTETLDLTKMTKDEMAEELDKVVGFMKIGGSAQDMRRLTPIRAQLEEALAGQRATQDEEVRKRDIAHALQQFGSGNPYEDFKKVIGIIQGILPDPDQPGIAHLYLATGMVIPVSVEEADGLKKSAGQQIIKYSSQSEELAKDVYDAYRERVVAGNEHPIVHGLVKWAAGVDDLEELEMFGKKEQARSMQAQIRGLVNHGKLSSAINVAVSLEMFSEGYAKEVGEWESELMGAAGRWVLGLTILKEGLTLLATAGAGSLIGGLKVAKGISTVRATIQVAGMTTLAGGGGALAAHIASEKLTGGDVSFGKAARATGVGLGTGLAIGAAPGAVASAKEAFGVGKAATTLGNIARGGAAEIIGSTPVNITAAALQGESIKDAAITSVVGGGITGAGGEAFKNVAKGGKVAATLTGAGVGGTAGTVGALAAGKDRNEVIQSGLGGVLGGGLGPHLEASYKTLQAGGAGGAPTAPKPPSVDSRFDQSDVKTASGGAKPAAPVGAGGEPGQRRGGLDDKFDFSDEGGLPAASEPRQAPVAGMASAPREVVPPAPTPSAGGSGAVASTAPITEGSATQPRDLGHAPTEAETEPAGSATAPADAGQAHTEPAAEAPVPKGAATAQSNLGEANTAAAPLGPVPKGAATAASDIGVAKTPAAAPGAAPRGGAAGNARRMPKMLPGSEVPADLPAASKPAIDIQDPSAGKDRGSDLAAEPGRPASVPTAEPTPEQPGRYVPTGEKPLAGLSKDSSFVVKDTADNDKLHLFKPLAGETPVDRAEARGVRKGEQGSREVGASIAAEEIGVPAAKARLVTINGKPGVLIEWHPKNSLADLAITNPTEFMRLINSEKFKAAMSNLDALDYLINNLDRARNFANYLYEFTPDGTLKLTAIDHGLTFTSTKERASISGWTRDLPEKYSPELAQKLRDLSTNRTEFVDKIRPFVGDEAIPGVLHRLDAMLADMTVKAGPKP